MLELDKQFNVLILQTRDFIYKYVYMCLQKVFIVYVLDNNYVATQRF